MGRPSKPAAVIEAEGKSHRTKAELECRKAAEDAVLSHEPLFERAEVRQNKLAHAEFKRVSKLMDRFFTSNRSFIRLLPNDKHYFSLRCYGPFCNIPENSNTMVSHNSICRNSLNSGFSHIICIYVTNKSKSRIIGKCLLKFSICF